jgi:hypothetical protein
MMMMTMMMTMMMMVVMVVVGGGGGGPPLSREKSRDVLEQPPEYLVMQEDSSSLTIACVNSWKLFCSVVHTCFWHFCLDDALPKIPNLNTICPKPSSKLVTNSSLRFQQVPILFGSCI